MDVDLQYAIAKTCDSVLEQITIVQKKHWDWEAW